MAKRASQEWSSDSSREALLARIRGEYDEMPGLCLTARQARRLWQIDRSTCDEALARLVAQGFLRRTPRGQYVKCE